MSAFRLSLLVLLLAGMTLVLPACAESDSRAPVSDDVPVNPAVAHDDDDHEEEEEEELAPYMASLQRYAEKLYLAGSNENWALAHFYGEELDEVAEEVAEGGFEEDGYDVSGLMETMLLPALDRVEDATETGSADAFDAAYRTLLSGCNGCHTATEHGFVKIRVPDASAYPSQDFTP